MARRSYSVGDIIFLGKLENGKMTVQPVCLVSLLSVSLDGELWSVRGADSDQLSDHFIQYPDDGDDEDDDGAGRDQPLAQTPPQTTR